MAAVEDRAAMSIVVLTALPVEYRAVRARLEEPLDVVRVHGSVFETGYLPGVAAQIVLGQSEEGNTAAAVLAGQAIGWFSPRAVFFVGVAGALKDDLQLGDVVVATKVDAVHGAKQQDGGSLARPTTYPMSHELLQVAKRLVAVRDKWQVDRAGVGFRVHLKPIASGQVVLDSRDAPLARELRAHYHDTVAIEMEGAGVAEAAHYSGTVAILVVRGISDRADGRKDEADAAGGQPAAAAHAAEVAYAVIKHWAVGLDIGSTTRTTRGDEAVHAELQAGQVGRFKTGTRASDGLVATIADAVAGRVPPVLRQLPADTALFTGRNDELDRLLALTEHAGYGDSPGTVVVCALEGMGGIGKTALAIRAAHRLAGRFPDGQLFIDLYGFTQGTAPRAPGDALATLLSSLGVPPGQIPADLDARAAFYRDRLAGTRTLILLDNAADEAQVRPLLPAADGCLVLITSRRRLKALDDALPVALDVLAPEEAVALLHKAARLDDRPRDEVLLARAAELCGRLPLALLIAGALLRTGGRAWNLPVLIDHLTARRPGRELAGYGDEARSLQAVFDLSYRTLSEEQRLLFRRLGLLPGPEIDAYAAAALLETDVDEADRLLHRLADHSLLAGAAPGRYRLHDLVRAHACSLAVTLDRGAERQAAQGRLLHYYAHTAQCASAPIARLPRPAPHGPAPAAPDLSDPQAARCWLRTEHPNLQAAHIHANAQDLEGHAIALAAGLAEILQTDGPWTRALEIHEAAAEAAARRQQPTAHAAAMTDLGRMRFQTGEYPGAADALTSAVEVSHQTGDRLGEANALINLGRVRYHTGDIPKAADAFARALEIYCRIGDRLGEANALTDLGYVQHLAGGDARDGDSILRALEIFRRLGNRLGEANALNDLGRVRYLSGDYPGATNAFTRALEISRQLGDRRGEANALNHLGRVRYRTGDYPEAMDADVQALEISRQLGNRLGEANALINLGRLWHATKDYSVAADALARALGIYRRIGARIGESGALNYLGQLRHATGDLPGAAHALAQALEMYRQIGDRTDECWVLTHYATTIAASGNRPRALALYQQALAMNSVLKHPANEALCLVGIGEHHLATGNPAQGIEHLRHALQIYQRIGMRPGIERVTARLALVTDA
jgi:nucleoside phosphorylase/tetratricopeptide (TPR) repeat protein